MALMLSNFGPLQFEEPWHAARARVILQRLPPISGRPVRLHSAPGLHDRRGPVHAGGFLRERRIAFDCTRGEFPRIFVHELFHFVWLRAGNCVRRDYERLLEREHEVGARGELGWSAEWRKRALAPSDRRGRTRQWREYCCESLCDTAAWAYGGLVSHPEFTLAPRYRRTRRAWFDETIGTKGLSI